MGARYENLYSKIHVWENLLLAWRKARKGKRGRAAAADFEFNAAEYLLELQAQLRQHTYQPSPYHRFYVHDPKHRLISAAPFCDRIAHHALCLVIEPLFERRFIHDSYANRRGRGNHAALDRCQFFARRNAYVLQADVEQFFPAIDLGLLLEELSRVIADEDVLDLCQRILEGGREELRDEYLMRYFPTDDLFAAERPRGLPIGNLTSQLWANIYLNPLDHFVKRHLRCRSYLRFVDDLLIFSDDKRTLWHWRQEIIDFLATFRLTLHERSCQARPVAEGIPFLGFVVYPYHRRLKRRKGLAYRRKLVEMLAAYSADDLSYDQLMASIRGWVNHAETGQTYALRRKLFRQHPLVPPKA